MLEYLKMTKKVHPNFIRMKKDAGFKDYWDGYGLFEVAQLRKLMTAGDNDE